MEAYIRAGGLPQYYQCDSLPYAAWKARGEASIPLGILSIIVGTVSIILYIPCLAVMLKSDLFAMFSYKMLLFLTICDILCLLASSVVGGIFQIMGIVYCNYPNFIYIIGSIVMGLWGALCLGSFLLGLSRLIDLWSREWHDKIFSGNGSKIVFLTVFGYFLFFTFCVRPVLFNSVAKTWLFDPFIYDNSSMIENYISFITIANNMGIVLLNVIIYLVFIITFYYKSKYKFGFKLDPQQKRVLIQCMLVTLNYFGLGFFYVIMMYVPVTFALIYVSYWSWCASSCGNLVVFLVFNQTMRNNVSSLLGFRNNINSIVPSRHSGTGHSQQEAAKKYSTGVENHEV